MSDETGATHLETSVGAMTMVDRDRWIYFDVDAYADQMGEILFDFECETDPDVSPCVDGNPRIVIHAPGGGDAILIIRFQPDGSLILNTDSHLQIEQVNLPNVSEDTWHVRDPYLHRAYQPKEQK